MNKTQKKFIVIAALIISVLILFAGDLKIFRNIENIKNNFGGIIVNNSGQKIKITEWSIPRELEPGFSSRDIGLFDADGLIISSPVMFEGRLYDRGVLKICNFMQLNIEQKEGYLEAKPSLTHYLCELGNSYGWHESLRDAFPYP